MNKQLEEGKRLEKTLVIDWLQWGEEFDAQRAEIALKYIKKLEAENKRFREALEFYANKKSYFNDPDETALFSRWCILYGDIEEINDPVTYGGKRAREALRESE